MKFARVYISIDFTCTESQIRNSSWRVKRNNLWSLLPLAYLKGYYELGYLLFYLSFSHLFTLLRILLNFQFRHFILWKYTDHLEGNLNASSLDTLPNHSYLKRNGSHPLLLHFHAALSTFNILLQFKISSIHTHCLR